MSFEHTGSPEENDAPDLFGEAEVENRPKSPEDPKSGQGTRIIYEEELRKACNQRALNHDEEKKWLTIRRTLPINHWIDRSRKNKPQRTDLKELKQQIEHYLEVFSEEAGQYPFDLDMNRNYYRAAINLLGRYGQGAVPGEKDRKLLTELLVMVDYKDAKLALQILESIV